MSSYTEVLEEINKLLYDDSQLKNFLTALVDYEKNKGLHWKKEYYELLDEFLKNNKDEN